MRSLIWTEHAIQRVAERIGFDPNIAIPEDRLLRTCCIMPDGHTFRQRIGPVIYVCKREGSHVVILTVVSSEMQNKRMKSHENHYSRKSKKIEW